MNLKDSKGFTSGDSLNPGGGDEVQTGIAHVGCPVRLSISKQLFHNQTVLIKESPSDPMPPTTFGLYGKVRSCPVRRSKSKQLFYNQTLLAFDVGHLAVLVKESPSDPMPPTAFGLYGKVRFGLKVPCTPK